MYIYIYVHTFNYTPICKLCFCIWGKKKNATSKWKRCCFGLVCSRVSPLGPRPAALGWLPQSTVVCLTFFWSGNSWKNMGSTIVMGYVQYWINYSWVHYTYQQWVFWVFFARNGCFLKWGYPIAGWLIMDNPSVNGWWLGVPPFMETLIWYGMIKDEHDHQCRDDMGWHGMMTIPCYFQSVWFHMPEKPGRCVLCIDTPKKTHILFAVYIPVSVYLHE